MDKQVLLIDCGAAETRAALLLNGEAIRFHFGPARGDEHLQRPAQEGQIFLGRVKKSAKSLSGAFVDIGERRNGFLAIKPSERLPLEGERKIVIVKRPALGEKGALLGENWGRGSTAKKRKTYLQQAEKITPPAMLGEAPDPAIDALKIVQGSRTDEIVVNDLVALELLRNHISKGAGDAAVSLAENPFELCDVEAAISQGLERTVFLANGARMIFDEAEGLTVVDVDSGVAAAGATGRLNDKTNNAAAEVLFGELSRRAIGGRVIVDFLPPSSTTARNTLQAKLKSSSSNKYIAKLGKLTADGVFDLTVPRTRYSLLETASEYVASGWLRPARRITLDWAAKRAVSTLSQRLCVLPSCAVRLLVGVELADYLDTRPQWKERLAAQFGARFAIVCDSMREGRSFDVHEN